MSWKEPLLSAIQTTDLEKGHPHLTKLFVAEDKAFKQVAFSTLAFFHECLFQITTLGLIF